MSLVSTAQSNPVVPKINTLLKQSVDALQTVPAGNPGTKTFKSIVGRAYGPAAEAVDLLQNTEIHPADNASAALKLAVSGVNALDALQSATKIDSAQGFEALEKAAQQLTASYNKLNQHHL